MFYPKFISHKLFVLCSDVHAPFSSFLGILTLEGLPSANTANSWNRSVTSDSESPLISLRVANYKEKGESLKSIKTTIQLANINITFSWERANCPYLSRAPGRLGLLGKNWLPPPPPEADPLPSPSSRMLPALPCALPPSRWWWFRRRLLQNEASAIWNSLPSSLPLFLLFSPRYAHSTFASPPLGVNGGSSDGGSNGNEERRCS